MFLALFLVLVPWIDGKYGKLTRLARVLTETRVAFILSATGFGLDLLIAYVNFECCTGFRLNFCPVSLSLSLLGLKQAVRTLTTTPTQAKATASKTVLAVGAPLRRLAQSSSG